MSLELIAASDYLRMRGWIYDPNNDTEKFRQDLQSLDIGNLVQLAEQAKQNGQHATLVALYQKWIALNSGRTPHLFVAWFNLGTELSSHGDTANAETCYRNALVLKADFYQASLNLGLLYENRGQTDVALGTWKQMLQPDEARTTLLNHQGRLLENLGRYEEDRAVSQFADRRQSIRRDPTLDPFTAKAMQMAGLRKWHSGHEHRTNRHQRRAVILACPDR